MIDLDNITLEQGQQMKLALERLLESDGWELVEAVLSERVSVRERELINCEVLSVEQLARYNRVQGGLEELRLIPHIMKQILADITEGVRAEQDRLDEEENDNG